MVYLKSDNNKLTYSAHAVTDTVGCWATLADPFKSGSSIDPTQRSGVAFSSLGDFRPYRRVNLTLTIGFILGLLGLLMRFRVMVIRDWFRH